MDVKSAFLNGFITEEVYVEQFSDFEDPKFINYIFKLTKVLYDLKQALRTSMKVCVSFWLKKFFKRKDR